MTTDRAGCVNPLFNSDRGNEEEGVQIWTWKCHIMLSTRHLRHPLSKPSYTEQPDAGMCPIKSPTEYSSLNNSIEFWWEVQDIH